MSNIKKPKVSIGMAVYNGENFVAKRLESLLSQTLSDFELIISDDSTDSTPTICKEFANKDKRIRYFHNEKKTGWKNSYIFLLNEAKSDYFVWASVDDIWSPDFLEKNVNVLESNKNLVGSISKIDLYGSSYKNELKLSSSDSTLRKLYKKIRLSFRPFGAWPLYGSYEKRASLCLRKTTPAILYSVFRTDKLRQCIHHEYGGTWDYITLLCVLEYGELHVIDEVLLHYYAGGMSTHGSIYSYKHGLIRFVEVLFPFFYLTKWCLRHFGIKFLLKNIDHFIWRTFYGWVGFAIEIYRLTIRRNKI